MKRWSRFGLLFQPSCWERAAPDKDDSALLHPMMILIVSLVMMLLPILQLMFPLLMPLMFLVLMVLLLALLLTVWLPSTFWLLARPKRLQPLRPTIQLLTRGSINSTSSGLRMSPRISPCVVNEACGSAISMLGVTVSPVTGSSSSDNSGVQPQDCHMPEASFNRKCDVSQFLSSNDSHGRSRSRGRTSSCSWCTFAVWCLCCHQFSFSVVLKFEVLAVREALFKVVMAPFGFLSLLLFAVLLLVQILNCAVLSSKFPVIFGVNFILMCNLSNIIIRINNLYHLVKFKHYPNV